MTATITQSATGALIDRYIAIWNDTDPAMRRALIDQTWAEDAIYSDPALSGPGRDGIDAMTAGFQAAYLGHTFERVPGNDREHSFGWKLLTPGGDVLISGEDAYALQADGLFQTITGTFNQP